MSRSDGKLILPAGVEQPTAKKVAPKTLPEAVEAWKTSYGHSDEEVEKKLIGFVLSIAMQRLEDEGEDVTSWTSQLPSGELVALVVQKWMPEQDD